MTRQRSPHVNAANRYARAVAGSKIPAAELTRLACQRHLDDLKRWKRKSGPYWFDAAAAERACRFIELLPHTKGRWAGAKELLKLSGWQCFVVCSMFGWKRAHPDHPGGLRRFLEIYIEVCRKNGKSTLAAAIGLYMFVADGEFGSEVYSGATTEKQAWEVFRPARLIALRTPKLREAYGIEVNAASLYREKDGSRFEPVIGNPGDGASPQLAIVDEFHEHSTPEQYETMHTGMGARDQPMLFAITTAGSDLSGPCYERRAYVIKILQGVLEDESVFGLIYTIDPEDDWTTEEALRKANPNFGISVSAEYLKGAQRQAMQSAARQNAFKTKHLNIWVGARNAWMNMLTWSQAPARLPLDKLGGRPCYMGLDLASKIDIAALLMLFPPHGEDPLWHVHGRYYLPEDMVEEAATTNASHYSSWAKEGLITLTPGNVIDFDVIEDELRDLLSRLEVKAVGYDPWQATQMVSHLVEEGAPMVEIPSTVKNLSEPMKQVEALVKAGKLAHGSCKVLDWMASNVVAKLDKKDNIYPNKERPENKIDGLVALFNAMNRALTGSDEKEFQLFFVG